jgi:Domain of unknown function (DUF4166)
MASARRQGFAARGEILLDDNRFRALLADDDWGRLPLATWRRFSKRLAGGRTVVYVGEVAEARHSRIGWWLAQLARIIGGPLPTGGETGVPIIVTVTEDAASGGQVWTRICARSNGFPQVIHSAKRFAGPSGLEEYIGFGLSMGLRLSVEHEALVFRSTGYFACLGERRSCKASAGQPCAYAVVSGWRALVEPKTSSNACRNATSTSAIVTRWPRSTSEVTP